MDNNEKLKEAVKEIYSAVSEQSKDINEKSLCGAASECCGFDYTIFSEDYSNLKGYCKTADLGVGCGIPTQSISIKEGDYVLDLGSGAGNDCFIARSLVGEKGKVIGLDFTPKMLKKAWDNCDKMKYNNVEFRFGDIEDIPVATGIIDVVISNCVINLVPNKKKAFEEIYRVLKPSGFFSVSDVVLSKEVSEKIRSQVDLYAGCVAGAIPKDEYLGIIKSLGFDYEIKKQKEIELKKENLLKLLSEEDADEFIKNDIHIYSVTIVGKKIEKNDKKSCCKKKNCC
jgi:arsenite methyltransferase